MILFNQGDQSWKSGCPDTPIVSRLLCTLFLHFCWFGQYFRVLGRLQASGLGLLPAREELISSAKQNLSQCSGTPYRQQKCPVLTGGLLPGGTASQASESGGSPWRTCVPMSSCHQSLSRGAKGLMWPLPVHWLWFCSWNPQECDIKYLFARFLGTLLGLTIICLKHGLWQAEKIK